MITPHLSLLRVQDDTYGPSVLLCSVCTSAGPTKDTQRVDPTLVSRYLGLLNHADTNIIVTIVEALPAVVTHTNLTSQMINQYLSLLDHRDKRVVSAICRQLPELISQHGPADPSQVILL